MESFFGISGFAAGGKHFPGISYPVVRGGPSSLIVPVLAST